MKLVSRFYLLNDAPEDAVATPPVFVAFDCLWARGRDLRNQPLTERRQHLEREIHGQELVLPVRRLDTDGLKAWDDIVQRGCEGLVAKDAASIYRNGAKSTTWLKVKIRRQGVFLIGGIIQAGQSFAARGRVGRRVLRLPGNAEVWIYAFSGSGAAEAMSAARAADVSVC